MINYDYFCGIDPGQSGALVVVDPQIRIVFNYLLPYNAKTKLWDWVTLNNNLNTIHYNYPRFKTLYILESGLPNLKGLQGAYSTGRGQGGLDSGLQVSGLDPVDLGDPMRRERPVDWMRKVHYGLDKRWKAKDKSHYLAEKIWGIEALTKNARCKTIHHGIMDAGLIALFGAMEISKTTLSPLEYVRRVRSENVCK